MNRRRLAVGAAVVSGVAAIGGAVTQLITAESGPGGAPAGQATAAVRNAAAVTAQARTAQMETVVTESTTAVPANGAVAAVPASSREMHGVGIFDFGQEVGRVELTTPNRSLEEVLTPSALYLRDLPAAGTAPAARTAAAEAKNWTVSQTGRLGDGNLISGGSTDPALVLAMLSGAQPDVKLVGREQVRGLPVTHYHGTVDLAAAAASITVPTAPATTGKAATPAEQAAQTAAANAAADKKALGNAARTFTTSKVPFDAYLDAEGRLARFTATFTFTAPGAAKARATVVSTTDLFGFGIPVGVSSPTAPASPPPAAAGGTATPSATRPEHSTGHAAPSPSRSGHK